MSESHTSGFIRNPAGSNQCLESTGMINWKIQFTTKALRACLSAAKGKWKFILSSLRNAEDITVFLQTHVCFHVLIDRQFIQCYFVFLWATFSNRLMFYCYITTININSYLCRFCHGGRVLPCTDLNWLCPLWSSNMKIRDFALNYELEKAKSKVLVNLSWTEHVGKRYCVFI